MTYVFTDRENMVGKPPRQLYFTELQDAINDLDGKVVKNLKNSPSILADIESNRPIVGTVGRIFIATDTKKIYRDSGTKWVVIGGQDTIDWSKITNKPTIPTKTSQLTNDSDFATNSSVSTGLAGKVDNSRVLTDVPAGAKFTDTVYTHPVTSGNKHIPSGGTVGQILKNTANGTATWQNESVTTVANNLAETVAGKALDATQGKVLNDKIGVLSELQTTDKSNLVNATNELFTSVSNGKTSIASAITDKGIDASGGDTFADLASKISSIQTTPEGLEVTLATQISSYEINKIITLIGKAGGGKIYFQEGDYILDTPLVVRYSNIHFVGYKTKLICNGDFATAGGYSRTFGLIDFEGTVDTPLENLSIIGITIDGNKDITTNKCYGIYCKYIGKGFTAGLADGGYDSTTVGTTKQNKKGITIEDCVIEENSSIGIYLNYSSNNNTVTGNTIQNNGNNGIRLNSSNNNTVTGNTIQNNSIGIYLNFSSNTTVTGNTIQNNSNYGIRLGSSSNNTVTGNTVQNNGNNGINLYSSSNNTVTGNTVQNNGNNGIYLNYSSNNNTVTGNTIQNNGNFGINLESGDKNLISSNIMKTNQSGNYLDEGINTMKLHNQELA